MKRVKKIVLIVLGVLILGVATAFMYFKTTQKTIAILLYDDFTMLDVVGAYQTFPSLYLKNYTMKFVAKTKGEVKSSHIQSLQAGYSLSDISKADILYIPGGENMEKTLNDDEVLNWIKKINKKSEHTLAVGTGVLLLAKTGALAKSSASTQWYCEADLKSADVTYVNKNYHKEGKYYTGKGASASIDMVLSLINDISGEQSAKAMQLFIEYDPAPPVQAGMEEGTNPVVDSIANGLVQGSLGVAPRDSQKTITMLLYPGFTMLDLVGPYQVFKELEPLGYQMVFVAKDKGSVASDMKFALNAGHSFQEIKEASILFIPGGSKTAAAMMDTATIDWVKNIDKTTSYSTSVCTGSLIYAKAGLLEGKKATSHWYAARFLKDYGVTYTHERYTRDGKYITGAGVSSGIDAALLIVKEVVGEDYAMAIQRKIGYHPSPLYDAGSPEKSDKKTVERLSKMYAGAKKRYQAAKEQ